jgi:alkylhydroperoxidase family enzyme
VTYPLLPLDEPYPSDVAEVLASYPQQNGYVLTLFRTFANSLRFLKKGVPNLLDKASPLPLRVREIVILRTTANKNCEYEWGVHVAIFANAASFSKPQIDSTRDVVIDASLWSSQEVNLLAVIDAFCVHGRVSDPVLDVFQSHWTQEQQLEILALCGTYHTISFVAATARLANEPFGASFPER